MAFSSGTFTFTSNSFAPAPVTGTTISSTAAASTWTELATALSTCVLKDGTQTVTANIPMATFKFTGLGAGSANGDSVRWQQSAAGVMTTTGDVLYASGANTPARLAIGTARQVLQTNSGATAPEWSASPQSVLTTTGDVMYASSANTLARLAVGALGTRLHSTGTLPEWQATWFKVGSFTRDLTAATGAVAITGVGFTPKALVLIGGINATVVMSVGLSDVTTNGSVSDTSVDVADAYSVSTTNSIEFRQAAGANQVAAITAFGSDGFTVTWTKSGAPTGTATVIYLAFR